MIDLKLTDSAASLVADALAMAASAFTFASSAALAVELVLLGERLAEESKLAWQSTEAPRPSPLNTKQYSSSSSALNIISLQKQKVKLVAWCRHNRQHTPHLSLAPRST